MKKIIQIFIFVILFLVCNLDQIFANQNFFLSGSVYNKELATKVDGINWDDLPIITNRSELAQYLNECIDARMTIIPLFLAKGFRLNPDNGIPQGDKTIPIFAYRWDYYILSSNEDSEKAVYEIYYYPGFRIADAYLNDDTSHLTHDELRVYHKILPFVKEVNTLKSDLLKELYIHDYIINNSTFKDVDFSKHEYGLRNISALGIFLDKIGNCQAHSDAFYMLGTMVGLKIGIMRGETEGEIHMWNTITLDGNSYFVDLSFNKTDFTYNKKYYTNYIYFNAPREIMKATHKWNKGYEIDPIVDKIDQNYFYETNEYFNTNRKYFGLNDDSAKEVIDDVAHDIVKYNLRSLHAMAPYDKYYSNVNNVLKYFGQVLTRLNWFGDFYINVRTNKKWNYMFYTFIIE